MSVKGRLKDMSLVDIIQIFNTERKTVAIHLGSEVGYGTVYIEEGDVVHASYREFTGAEALYHLLAWKDGEFDVEADAPPPDRTINEKPEALILEGLRRLDESQAKGYSPASSESEVGDIESIGLIHKLLELGIIEKI